MQAPSVSSCFTPGWRQSAVTIVEELFSQLPATAWDDLLELRGQLLGSASLEEVVDHFLHCRKAYEVEAYLPFYRLRTLLAGSLALQGGGVLASVPLPPMEMVLVQRHASLAEWKRQLEREWFEQGLDAGHLRSSPVALVEVASAV